MVDCSLHMGGVSLPQVEEFECPGVLNIMEGKMDCEIDRPIGAASAGLQWL